MPHARFVSVQPRRQQPKRQQGFEAVRTAASKALARALELGIEPAETSKDERAEQHEVDRLGGVTQKELDRVLGQGRNL